MTRITDEQRDRMVDAIWSGPDGVNHSIWAELNMPPVPPITDEERDLLDRLRRGEPVPQRWVEDSLSANGGHWVVG